MTVNIKILKKAIVCDKKSIEDLKTKELVKKMIFRRRLSRSSKIVTYLANECEFKNGCIIYGSAYGELSDSVKILQSINNSQAVSPTNFQNSVYNTAVSYHSILENNKDEILTLSSGDNTSYTVMQQGALASLTKDKVFVCVVEAMDFDGIEELNKCGEYLEYGVAFTIAKTDEKANIKIQNTFEDGVPNSIAWMKNLYDKCSENNLEYIVEVEL